MKNFSFAVLMILSLMLVACGDKDKGGGSSGGFSSDPLKATTVSGYVHTQQPIFEVGSIQYQLSQSSYQVMNTAFQAAQQQGIQPVLVNGTYKFKAKVTGSLVNMGMGGMQQQQMPSSNTLNVTSAVIYR